MAVITIAEYKAAHIIVDTPLDGTFSDNDIQAAINGATAWFESQLYQPVQQTAHDDVYNVNQSDWCSVDTSWCLNIYPPYFPVTTIDAIYWRLSPTDNWSNQFQSTDWSLSSDLRVVKIPFANPFYPSDGGPFQQARVVYTSGYSQVSMPGDIKQSVITLTASYLKRGYVGETGSGTPISILSPYDQKMVSDIIDKYKRRF